jgi:uncharacterized phiE125 gp8 family phage protein
MPSILLRAPAVEPVTLDEARSFLRVEHNGEDEVIAALVAGSRIHVESQTRRALITQSWRITADAWPLDGRLTILPAPLQALTAAREIALEQRARELSTQVLIAEQGRWYTALPRPLFALAFIVYVWKVVVFDKVLGLGSTDPLSGDVAQWAMIVLTAYFGGRSLEKVARILARK